jgi:hypothetical protein
MAFRNTAARFFERMPTERQRCNLQKPARLQAKDRDLFIMKYFLLENINSEL